MGRGGASPGLFLCEGSVIQNRFGVECGVRVGAGARPGDGTGAAGASSRGGQGGAAERALVVVTTDGSDERALVPEYGRGAHLEEMDELGKAGRCRDAHRVAEWRGGV